MHILLFLLEFVNSSSRFDPTDQAVLHFPYSREYSYQMTTAFFVDANLEATSTAILSTINTVTHSGVHITTMCFEGRNLLQSLFPISYDYRGVQVGSRTMATRRRVRAQNALVSLSEGVIVVNPIDINQYILDNAIGYVRLRRPSNLITIAGYLHWSNRPILMAESRSEEEQVDGFIRPFHVNLTSHFDLIPRRILDQLEESLPNPSQVERVTEIETIRLRFPCTRTVFESLPNLVYEFASFAAPRTPSTDNISVRVIMYPEDYLNFDGSVCETRIRSSLVNRLEGYLGTPFASVTTIVYNGTSIGFGEPNFV